MRVLGFLGASSGFLAVCAGAFGAHALKSRLSGRGLELWELASRYQLIHAVVIVCASILAARAAPHAATAGWLMILGTIIFSGSLYALALTGISKLGAVTPIGGALLVLGWAFLAWAAMHAP